MQDKEEKEGGEGNGHKPQVTANSGEKHLSKKKKNTTVLDGAIHIKGNTKMNI